MKAILLTGGVITEDDPLSAYSKYKHKSLIPIGSKPMGQWVLDALSEAQAVDKIYIIGLKDTCGFSSLKPIEYLTDQGSIFDNIHFGARAITEASGHDETIIVASADIPGLRAEMVDWLTAQIQNDLFDLYYSVVSKNVMESRFPGSNRSYIRFKDTDVCGGDINVFNSRLLLQADELWVRLSESRKSAKKQVALIGMDTLFLMMLKIVTMDQVVKRVCRKLKIHGKALVVPFAEMAMDVDKPHQLELIRADLAGQIS